MSGIRVRTVFTVIGWVLLSYPARLLGQDTASTSQPVARIVAGDPSQAGHFVVRITFPAGFHTDPHRHNVDLIGRVLRGRLMLGSGARFDTTRVVAVEQGQTTVVKAAQLHVDWWPAGGELEIEGEGPLETVLVDTTGSPAK
jgi:hypothetical protein